jgi:cytochrome P450
MFKNEGGGRHTVEGRIISQRLILTDEPENIKAILATQFSDFGKGKPFHDDWYPFLGDSIFATDGHIWHDARQLLRPQFIRDRISDLDTFERHISLLIELIPQGQTVELDKLFFRFTLDASTEFLLGRSVGSLHSAQTEFATAFDKVQHISSLVARVGPLKHFIPKKEYWKNLKIMNEFVNPFIDEALALSPDELDKKSKTDEGYTFLHAIAAYTRDRKVLRDQLVAVLLAGRDTTAATLSWCFWELAHSPETVIKLRKEILDKIGSSKRPTYLHLKEMKYLQNVLSEVLRLYPVVPFNVRLALCDTTLPTGGGEDGTEPIAVLKDTPVGYSPLTMQRRADIFGPTVNDFVPERWETWTPKPWTYIPFNGGPRICIGQQFALTEMAYSIVRILQRFERIEPQIPGGRVGGNALKADIILSPAKGVKVALWPVKS